MNLSLFNFEKSNAALAKLENLVKCDKCDDYYRNPQRHSECGYLLCTCYSSKTDTCLYCNQRCSQSNTSTAYQINSIIEATKTMKSLINRQYMTTGNKDKVTNKLNDNIPIETESVKVNSGVKDTNDGKTSRNFKLTGNEALHKKEIVNDQSSDGQKGKGRSTRASGNQTKTVEDQKAKMHVTKTEKPSKIKVSANIKVIMKRNTKGETKLHSACVKGDTKKVEEYLKAGADPCTKDNAGWTPLHEAVSKGHMDIVRLLLEAGALVNVPGYYNNTPLHDAALHNNLEATRLLITFGANPHLRNLEGFTPQMMAQSKEMESILKEFNVGKIISRTVNNYCNWQEIVLYGFNLSAKDQKQLKNVAERFKLKQVSSYKNDITHIIVSTSDKKCVAEVDILHCLLRGKWIVDSMWLLSCLNSNAMVEPTEYEILDTKRFPGSLAPKRSRENAEKMQPSIFNGCHFYFSGVDKITVSDIKFTKAQLSALVVSGDGIILTREPNPETIPAHECTVPYHAIGSLAKCSHYIIYQPQHHEPLLKYNMPHVKSLPVSWLLDCIETFTLIEP